MPQYSDIPAGATVVRDPGAVDPSQLDLPPGAKVLRVGNTGPQPDTSEADTVRTQGPLQRATDQSFQMSPLGAAVNFVKHPIQSVEDFGNHGVVDMDMATQAHKDFKNGNYLEGVRKALLGGVPVVGPAIKNIMEYVGQHVGEGDYAGAVGGLAGAALSAKSMDQPEGAAVGEKLAQGPQNVGRGLIQGAYKPDKWFRNKPLDYQNAVWEDVLQNKGTPDYKGSVRAGQAADAAVAERSAALDPAQRLPMDKMDVEAKNVPNTDAYRFDPSAREGLQNVAKDYQTVKFENAHPQEIQAAKQAIADRQNALIGPKQGSQVVSPSDITDSEVKASQYPSSMSAGDMDTLKKVWRDKLTDEKGRLQVKDSKDALINHMAGTANGSIMDAFPEVQDAGQQAKMKIDIDQLTHDASSRALNRGPAGITGGILPVLVASGKATLGQAGYAAMLARIVRDPALQARVASMAYRYSGGMVPLSSTIQRMALLANQYDRAEDQNNRDAEARNAKP